MNLLQVEECQLLGDSKYRNYVSQVEKALKAFDSTTEWADLISALAKLNKVLSSHVKYPVIPKRMVIGKRLAQCLHPALPGGVHLKALETYDIIFKCIGTPRLANDLFTYSAGLFPLLGYAAMNVRPALLTIYETHFVPLGRHVKPALTGLLLGLLPGLEEGSEYFDRTNHLLEEFCVAAESDFFYSSVWECVVSSPSVRQAAIDYVLRHFNKRQVMEDQLHFIGTNIELLVRALCVAVEDTSVLAQRGALDLLLLGFPLHQPHLTKPDVIRVLTSVVKVVLRRDMSLNRRLYAYLLGADTNGVMVGRGLDRQDSEAKPSLSYFQQHSRAPLVAAVKNCIHEQSAILQDSSCLHPFRILTSLLDRPDIGAVILEDVLLDVLLYMYRACQQAVSQTNNPFQAPPIQDRTSMLEKKAKHQLNQFSMSEIVKTSNLLFSTLEPYYIWEFLGRLFESVSGGEAATGVSVTDLCFLIDFLLDKISLASSIEIQTEYLPSLMRQITSSMTTHLPALSDSDLVLSFKLCSKILSQVEPSMCPVSDVPSPASANSSPTKLPLVSASESYVDIQTEYLPSLMRQITSSMTSHLHAFSDPDLVLCFKLCSKILSQVEPSMCPVSDVPSPASANSSPTKQASRKQADSSAKKQAGIADEIPNRSAKKQASMLDERSMKSATRQQKDDEEDLNQVNNGVANDQEVDEGVGMEDGDGETRKTMENGESEYSKTATQKSDSVLFLEGACEDESTDDHPNIDSSNQNKMNNSLQMSLDDSKVADDGLQSWYDTTAEKEFLEGSDSSDSNPQPSPASLRPRSFSASAVTIMQACLQSFRCLFRAFVTSRLLRDHHLALQLAEKLVIDPHDSSRDHQSQGGGGGVKKSWVHTDDIELDMYSKHSVTEQTCDAFQFACRLLMDFSAFPLFCSDSQRVLQGSFKKDMWQHCSLRVHPITDDIELDMCSKQSVTEQTCDAFQLACRLLMDFSAFPLFCSDSQRVLQSSFKKDLSMTSPLPEWFQLLLVCSCYVSHFRIHSSVVSTVLDLISLTRAFNLSMTSPLPEWFQLLLVCSCYVSHFRIHSSAVSTVLDLISLTQSVDYGDQAQEGRKVAGKVSVVIVPPLSSQELRYLENNTRFYQVVGEKIWSQLSMQYPERHQQSVELFYQLHQLTPQPWLCEDIIGARLTHPDLLEKTKAFQRFTVLWHLLKGVQQTPPSGQPLRNFDRSVLVVLESLQKDQHPCATIAQTWLTQALHRGEILRLLQPIMLILLHPDTARVSIQHVSFEPRPAPKPVSRGESVDESEANPESSVYAISSQEGHVIYHVNDLSGPPKSSATSGSAPAITAVTSLSTKGGSAMTQRAQQMMTSQGEREVDAERVNPRSVKITRNPFGSQDSIEHVVADYFQIPMRGNLELEMRKAKRLDTRTCHKEGLFFDEEHFVTSEESLGLLAGKDEADNISENEARESPPTVKPEDIVLDILEELISNVTGLPKDEDYLLEEICLTPIHEDDSSPRVQLSSLTSYPSLNTSTDELTASADTQPSQIGLGAEGPVSEPSIHPLHTHLLLYTRKYDAGRTQHAFSCLAAILMTSPRLMTCSLATTSLKSADSSHVSRLLQLLVRHRNSVFGKNFYGDVDGDNFGALRGSMLVETLILVCLYYVRSYYPNLLRSSLGDSELHGNKQVQMLACEVLSLLLAELSEVARDSGRGFATYISDVINRCKLQKTVLHCLLASVHDARVSDSSGVGGVGRTCHVTEAIVQFNQPQAAIFINNNMQIKLLELIRVLIGLEEQIRRSRGDSDFPLPPEWLSRGVLSSALGLKYVPARPLVYQTMFLSAVMSALKQQHQCQMHEHVVAMVTSTLPYLGRTLAHTVVSIVLQLCKNLDILAAVYSGQQCSEQVRRLPPEQILTVLEGLTSLCHYGLLDQQSSAEIWVAQHAPNSKTGVTPQPGSTNVLSGLINMFTPYAAARNQTSPNKESASAVSPVLEARRQLLSNLPRILASLATLWQACERSEIAGYKTFWILGQPKSLRKQMIEFVSPVSRNHGVNFLAAVAVVWNDRRHHGIPKQFSFYHPQVIDGLCDSQMLMVDFVSAVKVLPMDTLIQTVTMVIKQPPPTTHSAKKRVSLQVSMLQFFLAFLERQPSRVLLDAWPALLALIREGNALGHSLPAPGHFLLLVLVYEFVQKVPTFELKKDQKDLQDLCIKLLETVAEVAGSQLEQKSMLNRNLVVRPGCQTDILNPEVETEVTEQETDVSAPTEASTPTPTPSPSATALHNLEKSRHYSVHALVLLGELTSTLLDVTYRSEEKERVLPFLTALMAKVFPYLKNHFLENLPSLRGCSQIVASLSGYQYTRRAWKKEALDLLFEPDFFRMDLICIRHWSTIIDNLMTHDRTTFKELLARVNFAPNAAINLFTTKEQELEQRAQLMKRLSFTVFCSEIDQYVRAMPEIQERLSDSLRVMASPVVQAQVFYSFRVLVLRVSPHNLTSLWPTIISELILVLQQLEVDLTPSAEDGKGSLFSRLDNFLSGSGRGKQGPSMLKMYLAAFKLLEMALLLPTAVLPQFQLYKWAFVGAPIEDERFSNTAPEQRARIFVPHVLRILNLMDQRYGRVQASVSAAYSYSKGYLAPQPQLTMPYIESLQELHPFFTNLAHSLTHSANSPTLQTGSTGHPHNKPTAQHSVLSGVANGSVHKSQSMPNTDWVPQHGNIGACNVGTPTGSVGQWPGGVDGFKMGGGSGGGVRSIPEGMEEYRSILEVMEGIVQQDFLEPMLRKPEKA